MILKEFKLNHKKRPIRYLELAEINGWNVKFYGICSLNEFPDDKFIEIAKQIAEENLPTPAINNSRYGIAFVTIHQAEMFNQIIIDWWERVNELRHRVFKSEPESPFDFKDITETGEAFCVWELRVIGFERDAWVQTVLSNDKSIGKYLQRQLNEDA